MPISLNNIYKNVFKTDKRYIIITGGRGSAKSFSVNTFLALLTYEENQKILFTRYTMTAAEISIIPEFKEKVDLLEVPHHFTINSRDVTNNLTGNNILFRGIKASSGIQTANLKSINGVTCFVVDEAEEFIDEEAFDTIDLSIRSKMAQNRVIIIMNPPSKEHFMYKKWFTNSHKIEYFDGIPVEISTHPDVEHIHTTYLDNISNLDNSFLNIISKMKINAPRTYAHKAIGQWLDIAEGSLFSNLKTYKESSLTFDSSIAYIDVSDMGVDYTCLVIGRNIGDACYITDVVYSNENADITLALCAEALIRNKVQYCRVESNNMGAIYGRNLQKLVPNCQILGATSTTNKHTRILMDSHFISDYFRFKDESERSAMYTNYINDLRLYTKDGKMKRDDAPDATSGLAMFLRGLFPNVY